MKGIKLINLKKHLDNRGVFRRLYCKNLFKKVQSYFEIKQINLSTNPKKRTLRGLHYQSGKYAEKKIVYCTKGKIFFVAININKKSKDYLKYQSFTLDQKDDLALFIDKDFCTGFITLKSNTELLYFMSNFYRPNSARTIKYDEPKIGIRWPFSPSVISQKDKKIKYL